MIAGRCGRPATASPWRGPSRPRARGDNALFSPRALRPRSRPRRGARAARSRPRRRGSSRDDQSARGLAFVFDTTQPGPPVLSPDGRRLAFTARGADGKVRLYVRPLDSSEAVPLAGTEGAQYPFWSHDGRFIAFGADQKLKRIDASGRDRRRSSAPRRISRKAEPGARPASSSSRRLPEARSTSFRRTGASRSRSRSSTRSAATTPTGCRASFRTGSTSSISRASRTRNPPRATRSSWARSTAASRRPSCARPAPRSTRLGTFSSCATGP